jgi:hypothetical protein
MKQRATRLLSLSGSLSDARLPLPLNFAKLQSSYHAIRLGLDDGLCLAYEIRICRAGQNGQRHDPPFAEGGP